MTLANPAQSHYRREASVVRLSATRSTPAKGNSVSSDYLLQRVARGEQNAMNECVDTFGGLIWSLARRLSPNSADAEDAVQEVFVEVWRFANRFDPQKASETTFVAMLARRRLIDRLRKHGRQPVEETIDEGLMSAPSAEHAAEVSSDVTRVAEAMQQMKPEQQQALQLSAWMGMSHADIAEKMGLPLGTVKSHIRRGLLTLRDDLGLAEQSGPNGT